jgi:hypothetical protein
MYSNCKTHIDYYVNKQLEGKVLYLALYTKDDKYYAKLYDFTSFMSRVYLIIQSIFYRKYFEDSYIFTYEKAKENFSGLANAIIDVALVSYIKDGKLEHTVLINETHVEKEAVIPNFIYAIVEDEITGNDVNLTYVFNDNKLLLTAKIFDCSDIVCILTNRLHDFPVTHGKFNLKIMTEKTYNEHILKGNDNIITIISKDE